MKLGSGVLYGDNACKVTKQHLESGPILSAEASVKGGQGSQLPPHFLAEQKAPPAAVARHITTCITTCPPTLKSY